ncbi:trans-2-enoyl-CoA reductase family protein [Salmonella enterica subsp. enterica serovar Kisangani]|uniref:Enoyl-[acyl-carrier-protein] reductase [NADH] n=1 Tax=Comamonas resistens TaxID=3046670 RepID=A0ABY8SJX6_9BURK|nr:MULTISPECIES: enoyl-ACP reductase FabV [Pseudomonadota]ECD4469497.1 trans-2-enoyl-CoA reductase family protein [Salmonella enterica subsp. enterica serovar Kisangani]MDL5039474.1 trans-2-enoyl-CoA reductase family protein [Comamonas resistens]HDC4680875.1 trans-2-enoyl-CoA reductase family protein [Enterobacter kobei]MBD0985302.1 trans-2-enoyl-CoA reductase family protein [Klebsiella michiganensis]MCW5070003.1 trans-2-enoyl-CoA reductase family protein [Enterobacter chengduensis]
MIIKPKVRGFICTNAHPQGCAANVQEQIAFTKAKGPVAGAPKKVLVLGCSTGFGLASRITAAFGGGADTLGVCFEKEPSESKTATAGYYNTSAFHDAANAAGLYAETINGDAFSDACKAQVIETLKNGIGKVDLVIYSLASPRRTDPKTGEVYNSVLKPIGKSYTSKNLNTDTLKISDITIEPASDEEIANTVKVMGGEDWELWIDALKQADLLDDNFKTVAYTYLGDKLTWPIYGKATIGKAKEDLDRAARELSAKHGGNARVAVLKAVVTQASSAIPVMPLYLAILFKVMKEQGTHEGCIEQIQRLFTECLYSNTPRLDDGNRYRVDELELAPAVQRKVEEIWEQVTEANLFELTDFEGYKAEFLRLFGFGFASVDYEAETSPLVQTNF